ncbi:MAG: hypothetical protein RBS39_13690 [Phycisphaerales bacterium]|jgi:hypothetical protein|nr:hypothetical protein [Phycisphaerales bacterium]
MVLILLLSVAALPFGVVSAIGGVWFVVALRRDVRSRRWLRTMGRVEESRVVSNRAAAGMPACHWKVRYSYTVPDSIALRPIDDSGSVDVDADELRVGDESVPSREAEGIESSRFRFRSRRAASRIAARFTPGMSLNVAFDPEDPVYTSTLRPGLRPDLMYPAALCVVGAIIAAWLLARAIDAI